MTTESTLQTRFKMLDNPVHDLTDDEIMRRYDADIHFDEPHVLVGDAALGRVGLTTNHVATVMLGFLSPYVKGVRCSKFAYIFNPVADDYSMCTPSPKNPLILEPSKERAVVEAMFLNDQLNEGILIESIQQYLFEQKDDPTELYKAADKLLKSVGKPLVDYWVKEAREDTFAVNGG